MRVGIFKSKCEGRIGNKISFGICCAIISFLIQLVPTNLYANKNGKPSLRELEKETIYLVGVESWSKDQIIVVFGSNFQILDTSSKKIDRSIHRIGIVFSYPSLPFSAKYFPDVQELWIYEVQGIPVDILEMAKLRSLKIGYGLLLKKDTTNLPSYGLGNDSPFDYPQIDFEASKLMLQLPSLEEIYLWDYPPYLPEKLSSISSIKNLGVNPQILPLFFLKKGCKISLRSTFHNIPYPEIAALAAAGVNWSNLASRNWDIQNTNKFSMDSMPFWYSGSDQFKKPKINKLPTNGLYELYYPNGNKIVSGNMINNEPDGDWYFWFADNTLCETRHYNNGIETGTWLCNNDDGDTTIIFVFNNGLLEKDITFSYSTYEPRGLPKQFTTVKNEYAPNQKELTVTTINYPICDSMTSYHIRFFRNDSFLRNESFTYSKNILTQRIFYTDPHNTSLSDIYSFSNGVLIQKSSDRMDSAKNSLRYDTSYFENGRVRKVEMRHAYHITIEQWDADGTLKEICDSTFDAKSEHTFYNKNGKIVQRSHYVHGKLNGKTEIFNEIGEIIEERNYINGILIDSRKTPSPKQKN